MLDNIRINARSWGVKIIFGIIIVVFVFWGVGNMTGGRGSGLAHVNGEAITLAEYQKVLSRTLGAQARNNPEILSNAELFNELKRMQLDEMMLALARKQEAGRLGLLVTAHELKKYLYHMPEFQDTSGRFNEELYKMKLASVQISPDAFLQELENELLETKLMIYIGMSSGITEAEARLQYDFGMEKRFADYVLFDLAQYKAKAGIGDEEIAAYYDANKENFRLPVRAALEYLLITPETLAKGYAVSDAEAEAYYKEHQEVFRTPEMFLARMISIAAPPENSTEPGADKLTAEAEARMNEVLAALEAGENFSELAVKYSDDKESGSKGGELGWLEVGQTGHDSLDEAIRTLKPGETSAVLRSALGFHLLMMEDRKPSGIPPFAEVADQIKSGLAKERADEDFTGVQKAAEDALHLDTPLAELAAKFSLPLEKTGLLPRDDLTRRLGVDKEYSDVLVNAIAEAVASGKAATIPVPLNVKNGIVLVRILESAPSIVPPLDEVRADIRALLADKKAAELAMAAAEKALPQFTGQDVPEAFAGKVLKSKEVVRISDSLEPLGLAPELVSQLFLSKGGWMPQVFSTPKGPVIARLALVEKPGQAQWERDNQGDAFVNGYRQWQVNKTVEAYLSGLYERTKFEPKYEMLDLISKPR